MTTADTNNDSVDYGVDYTTLDGHKVASQQTARLTHRNILQHRCEVLDWSIGESASVIKTPLGYIASVVEGLGTKNLVLFALEFTGMVGEATGKDCWANIAQCNTAMALNDLATCGAQPIAYKQYFALADSKNFFTNAWRAKGLIEGTRRACDLAGCAWDGGETPELNGLLPPGICDLAGGTWGIISTEDYLINPMNIRAGASIVIITSNGIHANGLSYARKLVDDGRMPEGYATQLSDGRSFGEALLDPTPIYVELVQACLRFGVKIQYAVNVTGHGWRKFMRAPQPFTYVIDRMPRCAPVFEALQSYGNADDRKMFETFNMGAGFALYVDDNQTSTVIDIAGNLGFEAFVAGHIEKGDKKVVITPKDLVYTEDSMTIR